MSDPDAKLREAVATAMWRSEGGTGRFGYAPNADLKRYLGLADAAIAVVPVTPTTENREDSFLTAGGCRVSADDCDRAGLSAAAHTLRLAAEYLDRNRPSFAVRRALQKLHDTGLLDVGTATGVALAAAQHATGENPYAGKAGALAVAWGEGFAAGRAAATPDPRNGCRAPHCFSEYGTPCGNCPVAEKPETDT